MPARLRSRCCHPGARSRCPLLQHLGAPATVAVKPPRPGDAGAPCSAPPRGSCRRRCTRRWPARWPRSASRRCPTAVTSRPCVVAAEGEQLAGRALLDASSAATGRRPALDARCGRGDRRRGPRRRPRRPGRRGLSDPRQAHAQPGAAGGHPARQRLRVRAVPDRRRPADARGAGARSSSGRCSPPAPPAPRRSSSGSRTTSRRRSSRPASGRPRAPASRSRGSSTKYPQGGERQLVLAVLGRVVPTGGLPLDVGVVVVNVGTAAAHRPRRAARQARSPTAWSPSPAAGVRPAEQPAGADRRELQRPDRFLRRAAAGRGAGASRAGR